MVGGSRSVNLMSAGVDFKLVFCETEVRGNGSSFWSDMLEIR